MDKKQSDMTISATFSYYISSISIY